MERRLTKKKDFVALASHGRSIFGPLATLRVRQLRTHENTRIAFIVSTKVFKKAVDRNRAKRRLREAIRMLLPEIPPALHVLFIAKPESKTIEFTQLVAELRRLLFKIPDALKRPAVVSSHRRKYGKTKHLPREAIKTQAHRLPAPPQFT